MKKFFKALALVLALALVVGVVPAQSASAKIKAKKVLYTAAPQGWSTTDDTLKSSLKTKVRIYTLAGDKKAVAADHEYKAVIKSGEGIVDVTEKYVVGKKLGKAVVEIFKDGESLGTSVITVRKNADASTLKLQVKDGDAFVDVTADTVFVAGVTYRLALPRAKADSDERRLTVDDKAVEDVEGSARQYDVTFDEGEHTIAFEAFQGGVLDGATAKDSIKITAKTPAAKSAKQVSANSFEVTFDSAMKVNGKDLITKDNVANQDIYYLIAKQPVVTGVVKSVTVSEEDPKVVEIEMYSNFASDRDYYFHFKNGEPVQFHTAKNDIKYATEMKLIEEKAYYVGSQTDVTYKFYNEDGVELDINDQVATLSYESDVAYLIGNKIYFFKAGEATIKASIIVGYKDETNEPITLSDVLTVRGVEKTATRTGTLYSFGDVPSKQINSIRIGDAPKSLQVKYTLSDGTSAEFDTDSASNTQNYFLRSADERIAMIAAGATKEKAKVYGVSEGSTYIILCDKDGKDLDVFPITVSGRNRISNRTTIELSKDTLNLATLAVDDSVNLVIQGIDHNGTKTATAGVNGGYKYTIEQATNNEEAVGVKFTAAVSNYTACTTADGKFTLPLTKASFQDKRSDVTGIAVVRITVNVKDADDVLVATKTVSLVVSNQSTADAWKISATKASLDASIKDWNTTSPATEASTISAQSVKMVSGYPFFISTLPITFITSTNDIPVTYAASTAHTADYVIVSKPSGAKVVTSAAAAVINAFDTVATYDQNKTGTYTFTGIHVAYPGDAENIGVRTPMGTASVVVSKSDVLPTIEVIDGTAKAFKDYLGGVEGVTNTTHSSFTKTNADKVLIASWAGKNSKDHNDRVSIKSINYSGDKSTGAFYLTSVTVTVDIFATTGTYQYDKEVLVGKLFKDK